MKKGDLLPPCFIPLDQCPLIQSNSPAIVEISCQKSFDIDPDFVTLFPAPAFAASIRKSSFNLTCNPELMDPAISCPDLHCQKKYSVLRHPRYQRFVSLSRSWLLSSLNYNIFFLLSVILFEMTPRFLAILYLKLPEILRYRSGFGNAT